MVKKIVFLLMLSILISCKNPSPVGANTSVGHEVTHRHSPILTDIATPQPEPSPQHQDDFTALAQSTPLSPGKPGQVTLVIENKNGTAAQYTDFARTHGERIHVMIIDSSLTDYQHIHPTADRSDKLAIFAIPFTPQHGGDYVIVADVTPENDHVQRFLSARFPVSGAAKSTTFESLKEGTITPVTTADGFTFNTEIDPPGLRAGIPAMMNITITDKDGQLFRGLEPLMQAFAHLIGFSADRKQIVHTHPMGHEITSENERGGPNLLFHLSFPTSGYYRLFLQVRVEDKIITVPFDAWVAP